MPSIQKVMPAKYIPGLLTLGLFLLLSGCSSTPDSAPNTSPDLSTTDEQIFVGDSIEMSYDPNVIMKRAESFFEKESYAEAIVEYKHFLDLHRNHILAPYAQYKIGVSHYQQFRTVDRDPEPLKNAITGFEKLLKEFPGSRYETEAKQTILTCKEQLVQRHLMVGEFYFQRGSYLAAAHRYEKIINEFPELQTTGEAMFHLAKTYQDLGIHEWSQEWLVTLINRHPDSPYYSSAQSLLASLHDEHPTLLAALPPNALKKPETLKTVSFPESTTPADSARTYIANAGALPETMAEPTTDSGLHTTQPMAMSCAIGSWCESSSTLPHQVATPSTSSAHHTNTCQTGEWC